MSRLVMDEVKVLRRIEALYALVEARRTLFTAVRRLDRLIQSSKMNRQLYMELKSWLEEAYECVSLAYLDLLLAER